MVGGWSGTYRDPSDGNWYQRPPSDEDRITTEAIAETQDEMLRSAFDLEPEENTGFDEDLEQVEGFDGDSLSHAEQWHTTLHPKSDDWAPSGRPLQQAAENIQTADNQLVTAERDWLAWRLNEVENGPQARAQQQEQFGNNLLNQFGVAVVGDDNGQRFMDAMQQNDQDRLNLGFRLAHEQHGDDFVTAVEDLQQADQGTIQSIRNARDPGAAVMQWRYGIQKVQTGLPRFMPSLTSMENHGNSGYRGSNRSSGRSRDLSEQMSGFGDEGTEADIARSAWE
jgi:hypothetical protein